jgi:hypothetical protein
MVDRGKVPAARHMFSASLSSTEASTRLTYTDNVGNDMAADRKYLMMREILKKIRSLAHLGFGYRHD